MLQARDQLGIMEINGGNIPAALKHLSISAVGGLKTLLDLVRQLGYERGVLSESTFADIVKDHNYSAGEHQRYTNMEWRDMFAKVGLAIDFVDEPDTIVDAGLVGE